jgi:hypothetical protein
MFHNTYRMSKAMFVELVDLVAPKLGQAGYLYRRRRTNQPIPLDNFIAATVYLLGHVITLRQLQRMYGISAAHLHSSLDSCMRAVIDAVQDAPKFAVRQPSSLEEINAEVNQWSHDPAGLGRMDWCEEARIIGAGDGTLINLNLKLPPQQPFQPWYEEECANNNV